MATADSGWLLRRLTRICGFLSCNMGEYVTVADLAEYPGVTDRYASDRIRECGDAYVIRGGFVAKNY